MPAWSSTAIVERLEEEKAAIASDIRDIYAEAKGNGYDVKALRTIVRMRKQDADARASTSTILDTYMHALGMLRTRRSAGSDRAGHRPDAVDRATARGTPAAQGRARRGSGTVDTSAPPFKLPANQAGAFALGRLPVGTMNKTEAAYDAHLWTLRHAGEVLWHKFEGIKLRLADNTFLTVDFRVLPASRNSRCTRSRASGRTTPA
jgi:uncharacterized protein (UPF0335 family)